MTRITRMRRLASLLLLLAALAACDTPDRPAQYGAATPIPPAAGAAVPGISPAAPSPTTPAVPATRTPGLTTPSGGSPTAGPATGDGPAQPSTADLPPPPPLPTPPSPFAADGPDIWARVAAQVAFPLYVPDPAAGLVPIHGPWPGQFPLEAGGPGTYPGVAATYRVTTTGEIVTVVQMAGWPGDKARFGPLTRVQGVAGFYYEDAIQRRLIFQPPGPDHATDIMLRAPLTVGQDALFALAAGMQRVLAPAATATPPDPSTALPMILDLTFVDPLHGWLLKSSCLPDGPCTYTVRTSTDGGRTWPVGYPAPANAPARLRFASTQDGWFYGPDSWFTTHDGGATWTRDPQGRIAVLVAPFGSVQWAVVWSSTGGDRAPLHVLVSADRGRTWRPVSRPPAIWGGAMLRSIGAGDAWLLSAWDAQGQRPGPLWATQDGGQTWQPRRNPCAMDDVARLAVQPGDLWLLCAGQPGAGQTEQPKALYRSMDGGRSWTRTAGYDYRTPEPAGALPAGMLPSMAAWDLAASTPDHLWMILAYGWLARSPDGGYTWQRMDLPYAQVQPQDYGLGPLVFLDAAHGWVAGRSGLFRTTDGGEHWETITLP